MYWLVNDSVNVTDISYFIFLDSLPHIHIHVNYFLNVLKHWASAAVIYVVNCNIYSYWPKTIRNRNRFGSSDDIIQAYIALFCIIKVIKLRSHYLYKWE